MLTVVRLEERSNTACAVTSTGDRVHLAWTGSDLHLNLASSPDGYAFADKQRLAHESYQRRDSTDLFDSSKTNTTWEPLPPALAASGERRYLAWTGSDGALRVVVAERGAFSSPVTFKERTDTSPSVATSERGLTLAWIGTDRHVNLCTVAHDWSSRKLRLEEAKSGVTPAVCSHRGGLVVAWTGTDRRVNLLTLTDGAPTRPIRLEETKTAVAPAVCSHRGALMVAWAGSGRRLYVGQLEDRLV